MAAKRKVVQATLAVLKPDLAQHPAKVKVVQDLIKKDGMNILISAEFNLNKEEAEDYYKEHKGKFFYQRLTESLSSGPVIAMVLSHSDAISKWRSLLGPTKTYRSHILAPDTVRGMYGVSDTRNAGHGSDSRETAEREIKFFFPYFTMS